MLKRFNMLALIVLLVFQTMIAPVAVTAQGIKAAETPDVLKDGVFVDDQDESEGTEEELSSTRSVEFVWTLNENVEIGKGYTANVPEDSTVEQKQEGELIHEEESIGLFSVTEDGVASVEFNETIESLPDSITGTFKIEVVVEEEQAEEEIERNEPEVAQETKEKISVIENEEVADEVSTNNEIPSDREQVAKEEQTEEVITKKTKNNDINATGKSGFNLKIGKITDFDNKEYKDDYKLTPTDEFSLVLDWHLENNHNYKAGDTVEFDLPKQIYIDKDMKDEELKDGDGNLIANYTITTDNKVKLTFTDFVDTHSDVQGYIGIGAKLDPNGTEVEDGEITIDPIDEGESIVVPVGPVDKNKVVGKSGKPNKDYNTDEIDWTVTANGSGADLKDAKIVDKLPEGLKYKDGSLKVTRYKTNLIGDVVGDGEVIEITPDINDQNLTISLGDTKDKYVVEYTTTIKDETIKNFKNDVILKDAIKDDVPASATVPVDRGEPIKKSAVKDYDPVTGIIEWEIEFNYDQKSLEDVTLTDTWTPAGKVELEGDVEFVEVEIDEHGKAHDVENAEKPGFGSAGKITDGFEVSGITTDKAYRIIYKTKVKDRVTDEDGFTMKNVASFGDHSTGEKGTQIGQYYGKKTAGAVNYQNKTIDWTITLNEDKRPMKNIKIEDTFTKGQTLKEGSVNVTIGGTKYEEYVLTGEGVQSFTIEFPKEHETKEIVTITYKSDYDPNTVGLNPKNTAFVDWIPENSTDRIEKKKLEVGTNINLKNDSNHWKEGTYNPDNKRITWELIVNYRGNEYNELIITDTPVGNQKLVTDSVKVEELEVPSSGDEKWVADVTVDDSNLTEKTEDSFTLNLGETNKTYKVIYETTIAHVEHLEEMYENDVEISDGDSDGDDVSSSVTIPNTETYGEKKGKEVGQTIEWSINVNPGQHKVEDLKLTDTMSDNQAYLQDTIKVYEATVDSTGKVIKGNPYDSELYEVVHEPDTQVFEINWLTEVEHAFVVEYSTLFFANRGEKVTNGYKVTGNNLKDDTNQEGSKEVTIERFSSSGGSGKAGFLIVDKVDKEGKKLPGAKFELWDKEKNQLLISGVTDENGQISFGRLRFDDYTLIETETPDGYIAETDEHTIKIEKEYTAESDKADFTVEIENYVPVFAVELLKTDNDSNALKGAEFTLFDSEDNKIATETTNEDGRILFKDLENAGTYYVQETKAPAGYVLDETKHPVTIGEKEKEPVTITVKNKERGAVQLTKTDQDNGAALEGVEFVLQKENDSGIYETVKTYKTNGKGQIKTSNTLEAGSYQFVETEGLDGYRINGKPVKFTVNVNSTEIQELTMTNEQYKGSVKLIKKDAATNKELRDAEFKLIDSKGELVEENLTTNAQGEIVVDDLFLGKYQLIETKAPESYELDETPIDIEITEDNQVVEKTMTNNKITNISVEKKWNNAGGVTTPVTLKLLPTDQTVELNEGNGWKATFKNQDVYDKDGNEINYEIEELEVDGYNSEVTGDKSDGFIVTNTETTRVSGEKTWKDDNSNDRPDQITVKLLANGEKVATETVTAESDWEYEFKNLDKYDEDKRKITYTIDEVEVSGYETKIDGFDITNVRIGTIAVEGEKTWQDVEATDRPDKITVELSREIDGEVDKDFTKSETVKPDNKGNWKYAFMGLDEFNDEGVAYTYTVKEAKVPDKYNSEVDGYNIINTRTGKTEVSGTKRWKDDTVEDRPEEITINLLRNNVVVDTKELTADDKWKYTFAELDKYDDEGQLYVYTVKEQDVKGYNSEVKGTDITNTRAEKKDIKINKAWLDDDSEERPDSVVVYLKQNGQNFDTVELKADHDWTYTFTDLEAFDENGQAYSYSVEEKAEEGYKTTIDGFDITNLRVGETEVSGTKKWLDDNSEDRPKEITVKLLANGEETDETVTVDADSDWAYEFTELDKYDDQGKEIEYTVDEEPVEGYEKSIEGNDITNLRVGKTEVTGEKDWVEVDESYRPDSITVQLLANGEPEDTFEVSDETDWSYAFTGLEKYDDQGKEITYTVEEPDVPTGYESKVNGYNITNTQASTEVKGEKIWKEVDSAYRPDSITVQLLANGKKEATVEVTEETDWSYSFTDLAKYDKAGEEIEYTVEEVDGPANYNIKVDGYNITNTQKTYAIGDYTWIDRNKDGIQDENEEVLEGVKVELFDKDGNKLAETETDEDGLYIFDELPAGDYKVKFTLTEEQKEKYKFTKQNAGDDTAVDSDADPDTGWTKEFRLDDDNEHLTKEYDNQEVKATEGIDPTWDAGVIELIHISGTKIWLDDNSIDRPEEITVYLVANGEETDKVVTVDADSDWQYAFNNLDKYDSQGEEITYTVNEKEIDGYEPIIEDFDITNLRVGKIEIEITKSWNDENETNRPETITVNLLQNGELYKEYEVTQENDWKLTIKDLQQYDEAGKAYEYTVTENDVPGYDSVVNGFDITNTRTGTKKIEITKAWLDDKSSDRPDAIEVELFRSIADDDKELVETYTVTADNDWSLEVADLPAFDNDGRAYTYEIEEKAVDGYETSVNEFELTNLRVGETEVTVTKAWLDDNAADRPETITVQLFANGEATDKTAEVTAKSNWEYEFTNLDKYDDQGVEITYTVDETEVPEGYEKSIEGNNITNLRVGTTEIEVEKLWKDEQETDRPDTITINLLQNGDFYKEYEVTKENDWKLTIEDLPQYDEAGKAYEYIVTEHDVAGYAADVDGFEITNTRTDKKTIEINKSWLDTEETANRPDAIEVDLFRSITDGDKELVGTYTVTAENDWSLEITELPTFDNDGKAYTYEIEEKAVEGYETTINGFDITNLRVGETEVEGTKTWLDDNSEDRPETITVQLFANGEETDKTVEVTAETEWKYEFTGLDKYDNQGIEITYTIDEVDVPEGYEKSIEGNDITNVRVGTTEVSGEKSWVEVNEQYRPDSITVNLLANGEELLSTTASAETDWTYTFADLAKYDAKGKEIEYTIEEVGVPGYVSEVDGYNITNTQETTNIIGTKTWIDDNATDRPDSITVQVMNGDEVVQEQEVTAEDNWIFTFTDLAKYDSEGNEVEYTINELPVPGYATEIDGFDITNTRADVLDIAGTKTWKDDNAEDRPASITVQLLANGEVVDSIEVTAETDWAYIFENKDGYDAAGAAIVYTVAEVKVEGYETSINGFDITNTLIPVEEPEVPEEPELGGEDGEKDPGDRTDLDGAGGEIGGAGGEGDNLPKTATNMYNLSLIGFGLILLGLFLFLVRRKKVE